VKILDLQEPFQDLQRSFRSSKDMASADQTELRVKFLQEAAHLLALPSPTAAAFLGNARNKLIEDAEVNISSKESDAFRRSICGACGNVMIPGWSCKVSNGGRPKSVGRNESEPKKSIRYTCLRCQRETLQTLQRRPRKQVKRSRSLPDTVPISGSTTAAKKEDDIAPKAMNASSKQRQRARKGGLQAMLDKKKTQDAGSGGLDFIDFAL
jgi:RNase P subunit RPR2